MQAMNIPLSTNFYRASEKRWSLANYSTIMVFRRVQYRQLRSDAHHYRE